MKIAQQKVVRKSPETFTSRDLLSYWLKLWGTEASYSSFGGGKELSVLKSLLESYDVYTILLAMVKAKKKGSQISILTLADYFDEFAPDTKFTKLSFYVGEFGDEKVKKILNELIMIEYKWLPSASDRQKAKELVEQLETWIEIHVKSKSVAI